MKREKAFTLVELLAVIAILAIILLIAVPQILGVIDSAKIDSFRNSVRAIFNAVELSVVRSDKHSGRVTELELSNQAFQSGNWEYNSNTGEIILTDIIGTNKKAVCQLSSISMSGEFPVSDYCDKASTDPNPGVLEGEGTEDKPFIISSMEDLIAFSYSVDNGSSYQGKKVVLGINLDFNSDASYHEPNTTTFGDINGDGTVAGLKKELTTGKGFPSIGKYVNGTRENDKLFLGYFEGNNKTISNLYINDPNKNNVGLFEAFDGVTISNLNIVNAKLTALSTVGILVGYGNYYTDKIISNINNVNVSGEVKATAGLTAGLAGSAYANIRSSNIMVSVEVTGNTALNIAGGVGYFTGSAYDVNVQAIVMRLATEEAPYAQVGGLFGTAVAGGEINNCHADVNIGVGTGAHVGGLIGHTSSPVTNSSSKGTIIAGSKNNRGGLIGYANALVENSSSSVNVKSTGLYIGGLIGAQNVGFAINNSYATGDVYKSNAELIFSGVGGLVGSTSSPINKSYATGNVTGEGGISFGGLVGYTYNKITDSHATGNVEQKGNPTNAQVGGLVGSGSADAVISDSYATGTVKSTGGNYVGGLVGYSQALVINSHYKGTEVSSKNLSTGGLIGYSNGIVNNSTSQGTVTGNSSYIGGLIGYMVKEINDCSSTANVIANDGQKIGGLVGKSEKAIINSNARGTVTLNNTSQTYAQVGGLVGSAELTTATITDSYADTKIIVKKAVNDIGGLVGYSAGKITNASAVGTMDINGGDSIGGLVGRTSANIENSHSNVNLNLAADNKNIGGLVGNGNDTSASIINCYAAGNITSAAQTVVGGGLVGIFNGNIKSSYYEKTITLLKGSYVGGLAGRVNGTISSSRATGQIISPSNDLGIVGGLVGYGNIINDSYSTINIVGSSDIGGLASSAVEIRNSYATGNVTVIVKSTTIGYAGGLAGTVSKSVKNCYATGNVSGDGTFYELGGLIGLVHGLKEDSTYQDTLIENSYATGNVSATGEYPTIGGLAGATVGIISEKINTTIRNCYATGNLYSQKANGHVGGIIGDTNSDVNAVGTVTIQNSFYTGNITGLSPSAALVGSVYTANSTVTNSYRYAAQTIQSPINNLGTAVDLSSLKTSAWFKNTLGFNNNWQLRDGYYPKIYKIDDALTPTTTLLGGQTDKSF